jgi:hypothetical protein
MVRSAQLASVRFRRKNPSIGLCYPLHSDGNHGIGSSLQFLVILLWRNIVHVLPIINRIRQRDTMSPCQSVRMAGRPRSQDLA